jgi:predicted transcriptional regulator
MARPRARELTERELEVMQACWEIGECTVADVRERLARDGRDLAYTTVATLVRILMDKGFLEQTTQERPYQYKPVRSFEDVSGNLLTDLVAKVFGGSREALLVRLMDQQPLSRREREKLAEILNGRQR